MIVRVEGDNLVVFEKRTAMTALFSESERDLVLNYAKEEKLTPFIKRLYDLGIFHVESFDKKLLTNLKPSILPRSLHIELTDFCPLRCPQCYKELKSSNLSFDKLKAIIEEAKSGNVFQIALGGGEPLSYPRLLDVIELIAKSDMSSSITTSGYYLDSNLLDKLIKCGLNHIQISLNSSNSLVNKLSRDGYEEAINALNLLSGKISFGINFVARKDNLDEFDSLCDFADLVGANNINILRYKRSQTEDFDKIALSDDETKYLASLISKRKKTNIKVDSAYSNLLCFLSNKKREFSGCGAGTSFYAITADGFIKPCSHLDLSYKLTTLAEYALSSHLKEFLNEGVKGICKSCLHNKYCGGCKAISPNGENSCVAFTKNGL